MTLSDYRQVIYRDLLDAPTTNKVHMIISSAHDTLISASISPEHQRWFWTHLYDDLKLRASEIFERQSSTALSAIIAAAQAAIAAQLAAQNKQG